MRGEGTVRCADGGCGDLEIEGLEYCLAHMPEDLLAEAEAITGVRRARKWGPPDMGRGVFGGSVPATGVVS